MPKSKIKPRTDHNYTSTGGLLFFAAALSIILVPLSTDRQGDIYDDGRPVLVPPMMLAEAWSQRCPSLYRNHGATSSQSTKLALSPWSTLSSSWNNGSQKNLRGDSCNAQISSKTLLSMSFSSFPVGDQEPLATEGNWAAYIDGNYGNQVYYFNHATGESSWEVPTPTFPKVSAAPEQSQLEAFMTSQRSLYDVLDVPPNATRAQIKESYLKLAKEFHPNVTSKSQQSQEWQNGGDEGIGMISPNNNGATSEEFNEIARAWMILSDDNLRKKYDSDFGGNFGRDFVTVKENDNSKYVGGTDDINSNTVDKGNPLERMFGGAGQFMEKTFGFGRGGSINNANSGQDSGNKFDKKSIQLDGKNSYLYNNTSVDANNTISTPNKFREFNKPPLEQSQIEAEQVALSAEQAWQEAVMSGNEEMEWEDDGSGMEMEMEMEMDMEMEMEMELRQAQEDASRLRREFEDKRNKVRSERDAFPQRPPQMSFGQPQQYEQWKVNETSMEERFKQRKTQEAYRVKSVLENMQQLSSRGNTTSFPFRPMPKPPVDEIPLDKFISSKDMPRPPRRTSSDVREEQRLNSLQKLVNGGNVMIPPRNSPGVAGGNDPKLQDVARKMQQTYDIDLEELDGEKGQNSAQVKRIRRMQESHRVQLDLVRSEVEADMMRKMADEMSSLNQKHAVELNQLQRDLKAQAASEMNQFKLQADQKSKVEVEQAIRRLKDEHAEEIARLKSHMLSSANSSQTEQIRLLNASHQNELRRVRNEMQSSAAKELDAEILRFSEAHEFQLEALRKDLASDFNDKIAQIQEENDRQLNLELTRRTDMLRKEHEKEMKNLRRDVQTGMDSSADDRVKFLIAAHEDDMKRLQYELENEAAINLQTELNNVNEKHIMELESLRTELLAVSDEKIKRAQSEANLKRIEDMKSATEKLKKEHAAEINRIRAENEQMANMSLNESVEMLRANQRQELERLRSDKERSSAKKLENEVVKLAKIHANELSNLRDSLESAAAETIRGIKRESNEQRKREVEEALQGMKANQNQENIRMRNDIMKEANQTIAEREYDLKAAHTRQIEKLKAELNDASSRTLASEIEKVKRAHNIELDKVAKEVELFYVERIETLKRDIRNQNSEEMKKSLEKLDESHAEQMERVKADMMKSYESSKAAELARMASAHKKDMEQMKHDMLVEANDAMKIETDRLVRAHEAAMEKLRADLTAQAAAETLRVQTESNRQLAVVVERETQQLKHIHSQEMARLKEDMISMANLSESEKMTALEAAHNAEMERRKSQMESSFSRLLQDELQKMKSAHELELKRLAADMESAAFEDKQNLETEAEEHVKSEVNRVTIELQNAHAAEMAKSLDEAKRKFESMLSEEVMRLEESHRAEKERIQLEMKESAAQVLAMETKKLRDAHVEEIESLRKAMLETETSQKNKIEALKASFNQELERLKAVRGRADNVSGLSESENIDLMLSSLHSGSADLIEQLRFDLKGRDEELGRLSIGLNKSTKQMAVLQSQLSESKNNESALKKQLQATKLEIDKLKRETRNPYNQSAQVASLEREIRKKSNELNILGEKLKKTVQNASDLESKLDKAAREKKAMTIEVNKYKTDMQSLEANVERLQDELRKIEAKHRQEMNAMENNLRNETVAKDGEIQSLKCSLQMRSDDVDALVPEVTRLQGLNYALQEKNDVQSHQVAALKSESDCLKAQVEKEKASSEAMIHQLNAKLTAVQLKNDELVRKLESDAKAKNSEILRLKDVIFERSRKVADLESKIKSIGAGNTDMMTEIGSLKSMQRSSEKLIDEKQSDIVSLKAEIDDLKRQLSAGRVSSSAKNSAIQDLEKKLRSELTARSEAQRAFEMALYGKDKDIKRLQQELATQSAKLADLESQLDRSNKTNKNLSNEIGEFKRERYSTELKMKKQSSDLNASIMEVQRLKAILRSSGQCGEANENNSDGVTGVENKGSVNGQLSDVIMGAETIEKRDSAKEAKNSADTVSQSTRSAPKHSIKSGQKSKSSDKEAVVSISSALPTVIGDFETSKRFTKMVEQSSQPVSAGNKRSSHLNSVSGNVSAGSGEIVHRIHPTKTSEISGADSGSNDKPEKDVLDSSGLVSGWAGYKNNRWGGYLDSLSRDASS